MDRKDRGEINNLNSFSASGSGRRQHQAPNYRDASASSQSHSGPWKNDKPTPISVGSSRISTATETVKRNNLFDDLPKHSSRGSWGNPTASKTILNTLNDPANERGAKRTRLDPTFSSSSTSRYFSSDVVPNTVSGSSRGHRVLRQKSATRRSFPPDSNNVIHISDDDDIDTGQVVPRSRATLQAPPTSSPDPLRLGSATHETHQEPHPFDGPSPPHHTPFIQDSDSMKELREKHLARDQTVEVTEVPDSEPEEIDQFSDPMPGPSKKRKLSLSPPHRVRDVVQAIEQKRQGEQTHQGKPVRHVDLQAVNRKTGPVAGNMKPRTALSGLRFKKNNPQPEVNFVNDPDSAPSLGPSPSKSKKGAKSINPKCTFKLPLEAWTYGFKLFNSDPEVRYWFCWDEVANKILIKRGPPGILPQFIVEEFGLYKASIHDITLTNTDSDDPKLRDSPVVQISLGRTYSPKGPRSDPSAQFRRLINLDSERGESELTFKFSRDPNEDQRNHDQWRDSDYQQMFSFLRRLFKDAKKFHVVTPSGASTIWQTAQGAANVKALKAQRNHSNAPSPPPDSVNGPATRPRPRPRPRFSGNDEAMADVEPLRRSARTTSHKSPSADPDELILVYPSSGPGAINITRGDLNRLEDGEYLNDTLIEFGLKLWLSDLRETDPDLADQIHVFSSFFYKKLRNGKVEDSYQSVRKWTQKFDVFKKTFLIVPINEHLHWYLAIIYQPQHVLQPPPLLPPPTPSVSTRGRKNKETEILEQVMAASKADTAETMQVQESVSRPVSPSDGQAQEEVEEMFQSSCSISSAQSQHSSNTKSSNGGLVQQVAEADDSMIVDDDRISPELQYPAEVESTHSGSMEVDELEVDELEDDATPNGFSAASSEPTSRALSLKPNSTVSDGSAVTSTNFYASTIPQDKGKGRAVLQPSPLDLSDSDKGEHEEVNDLLDEPETSEIAESSTSFIFTLDSLGSRHHAAINSLKSYLKLEAKDKRGIGEASDAKGFQAFVPIQPNYCDCGLYLLHFAKTFVKRPEHHRQTIVSRKKHNNQERQEEWEHLAVATSRQDLKRRIGELSEVWKKERAAKQEQKKQEGDKTESSDSEIDIVEDATKATTGKKTKATRFRG